MLYVSDSREDDGLKCRYIVCFPADITVTQLREKVQKHLIIRRAVNLIDHQNYGQHGFRAPISHQPHQIFQLVIFLPGCYELPHLLIDVFRDRNLIILQFIQYQPDKAPAERLFRSERRIPQSLKIKAYHHIFGRQRFSQRIQSRRLSILPGPIDREILARIHHLFDLFYPLREIDHIMFCRYTYRCGIEFFHPFSFSAHTAANATNTPLMSS